MKSVSMIHFIINLKVFSKSQSVFLKGHSCVSQSLSIRHEISKDFDTNRSLDTCGIFFDISKAFDRVWHEALIFKLRSYGILDSLLCLFNSFLPEKSGFKLPII